MNTLFVSTAAVACIGVITSTLELAKERFPYSATICLAMSCYMLGAITYAVFVK